MRSMGLLSEVERITPVEQSPLPGTRPTNRVAPRILIVDDYEANLELLAACLERLKYEVVSASSGQDALSQIVADPPDVVLMDVVMPGLSGLDVLRTLRNDAATADLPVIMVSGLGETGDIVEGLKLGANDYVTKPIDIPILQARLATHTALKRAKDDLKRTALLLSAALDLNARELAMAAHVQRSILPRIPPLLNKVTTAWCYEPATEVGGDLFDVVPMSDGRTFLFVADAMGHGVQAALVVSTVKATLAAHLADAEDLPLLLNRLDESLGDLFDDRFVTAAACIIDPERGILNYAVAGHPPILLDGPNGLESLSLGGLPLGTDLGLGFRGGSRPIVPGSTILLYSDGLTEAEGTAGDEFGVPRLLDLFQCLSKRSPETLVNALRAELHTFQNRKPLNDDLTLLVARLD